MYISRVSIIVLRRDAKDCSVGNVLQAVGHARNIRQEIALAKSMDEFQLYSYAQEIRVPYDLLRQTVDLGKLPVVNFAAGGLGNNTCAQPPRYLQFIYLFIYRLFKY